MLTPEAAQLIGKTDDIVILEVEKGAVRKFADAVDDRNPLYWDEEYARGSKFGTIVAPPAFFGWPVKWEWAMPFRSELRHLIIETINKAGYVRLLDGGIEYDFHGAVRVGDILSAVSSVKNIYERESKTGTMVFSIMETTYINQNGDTVASARHTLIHR